MDKYVWQHIFLKLHPKYNKILRKVCKRFYEITNDSQFLKKQTIKFSNFMSPSIDHLSTKDFELQYMQLLYDRKKEYDDGFKNKSNINNLNHLDI